MANEPTRIVRLEPRAAHAGSYRENQGTYFSGAAALDPPSARECLLERRASIERHSECQLMLPDTRQTALRQLLRVEGATLFVPPTGGAPIDWEKRSRSKRAIVKRPPEVIALADGSPDAARAVDRLAQKNTTLWGVFT